MPYRSTARIVAGDACVGETPAAWMTPVTSPSAVAASTSAWTDSREDTSTVAVLTSNPASLEHLCRRVGVFLAQVGQQDVLARADPPRDRLTDRPGADDDHDVAHDGLLSCWVAAARMAHLGRTGLIAGTCAFHAKRRISSKAMASRLLPQPGGFEGFVLAAEALLPDDQPVPDRE